MPYTLTDENGARSFAVDPEPPDAPQGGLRVGEPLGLGMHADWIVLDFAQTSARSTEGVALIVRPHRYHPFVTERYGWTDAGDFTVWGGTYHETLDEAVAEYRLRRRS